MTKFGDDPTNEKTA